MDNSWAGNVSAALQYTPATPRDNGNPSFRPLIPNQSTMQNSDTTILHHSSYNELYNPSFPLYLSLSLSYTHLHYHSLARVRSGCCDEIKLQSKAGTIAVWCPSPNRLFVASLVRSFPSVNHAIEEWETATETGRRGGQPILGNVKCFTRSNEHERSEPQPPTPF